MKGFRLIGLHTLDRPDLKADATKKDFLKVLQDNTFYPFYHCFDYSSQTNILTYLPDRDVDLYSSDFKATDNPSNSKALEKGKIVYISAVVGQNGSGKSTLLELLFLAIHNLSAYCNVLKDPDEPSTTAVLVKGVGLQLIYQSSNEYRCIYLKDDFTVEISVAESDPSENTYNFVEFNPATKDDLIQFCYSVAINYSLYGLNTRHINDWIRALFHKNDGYQTPVVLNPMRTEGIINVNSELDLAMSRLLANLLLKSENDRYLSLTPNQKVVSLQFELQRRKVNEVEKQGSGENTKRWSFEDLYNTSGGEDYLLSLVYKKLIGSDRTKINAVFKEDVEKYIIKKLFKIARKYTRYKNFLYGNSGEGIFANENMHAWRVDSAEPFMAHFFKKGKFSFSNYLDLLKTDESHITYKLRQAVNYLIINPLYETPKVKWILDTDKPLVRIGVSELSSRLGKTSGEEIVPVLPPSLFRPDILLSNPTNQEFTSWFGELSSGEQQKIHTLQTIVYHVQNLNSVFKNGSGDDLKYRFVNLILDEVELYFHPEFQRKFVSDLLHSLKNAVSDEIKGYNILFATHSPFILSDIPAQNVLRLKNGEPQPYKPEEQTFGANIHDLLANDFFLENGFMGEFAKEKINQVITFLNHEKIDREIYILETKKGSKSEIDRLVEKKGLLEKKGANIEISDCEKVISMIGEPALKHVLLSQLAELTNHDKIEPPRWLRNIAAKEGFELRKKKN